jgi:hypothetical protein
MTALAPLTPFARSVSPNTPFVLSMVEGRAASGGAWVTQFDKLNANGFPIEMVA